jgi:PH (Pleckstrin Homology) domain-containing protein
VDEEPSILFLRPVPRLVFRPSPSHGYLWLVACAVAVLAPTIAIVLPGTQGFTPITLIPLATSIVIGLPFLVLAALFPTMRYELDAEALTLRYGPVLRYRIPYDQIQGIQKRDLSVPVWSSLRLPGLALFVVPYNDVGPVRMCATRAATDVLLIRTSRATYGLTPADERGFLDSLMARIPR